MKSKANTRKSVLPFYHPIPIELPVFSHHHKVHVSSTLQLQACKLPLAQQLWAQPSQQQALARPSQ
jgi:hypothetical protein